MVSSSINDNDSLVGLTESSRTENNIKIELNGSESELKTNLDDFNLNNEELVPDIESQKQNDTPKNSESKFLNLYKSMGLADFKNIDKFKRFLKNPLATERNDDSPTINNQQIQIDVYSSEESDSDSSSFISDYDEKQLLMDLSEDEITPPVRLKDLMIYKTIQFMDYRRLSRRFNGIRKPVSNKKALIICLFCAILALVPFVVFSAFDKYYVVSLRVTRGALPYVSSIAFLLAAFLLAKIQLSLPLKVPVILSYIFMFITLIALIVLRNTTEIDRFVWPILISYASVQVFLIALTKCFIYFVPILALHGKFFPCTEHFHLLNRIQKNQKLTLTISRYNDYTSIWETNSCGLFTCIYRSMYRLILSCRLRFNKNGKLNKLRDYPLFGHQMRYTGKIDSNNLPHGYGEWLEDHIYGERLHGYWWHGFPIGPFTSQEIGSGSIFVNNRVAFMTDTHLEKDKIRYGVSSTECSISGYFFRQMPRTFFFNPEYRIWKEKKMNEFCDLFYLHRSSFEDIKGSNPQWCIGMLKRQFHLNTPSDRGYMSIYIDKLTDSLKIEGYRAKNTLKKDNATDEITIKLVKYKGAKNQTINPNRKVLHKAVEFPVYRAFTKKFFTRKRKGSSEISDQSKNKIYESKISMLIKDEDDWGNKQHMLNHKIVANGWSRLRPSAKKELIPEQVVIYIHGYNLTLNEACSQMAHIVSFAKLPPYILPFIFNWDGCHWGMFSAFAYPKAIKICNNPNIEESFIKLMEDLINLGIKNVHFLVHSCGARVFFKVVIPAIKKGLIMPVLDEEFLVVNPETMSNKVRMDSLILINPDYPMEKFRNNDYFILRGYCDHIVMYVNNRDQCLWVSEFYNREKSLGKSIFEMCTSQSILSKMVKNTCREEPFTIYDGYTSSTEMKQKEIDDKNEKCLNLVSNSKESKMLIDKEQDEIESNSNNVIVEIEDKEIDDQMPKENEEKKSGFNKIFKPRYSMNKYRKTKNIFWTSKSSSNLESYEDRNLWLDMDVIDTTMIDTNVDFLKHSFYQVKREIMDDIREVIVMHTRAEHRQSRLDRRRGNVYVFRVAPGDVRKLF